MDRVADRQHKRAPTWKRLLMVLGAGGLLLVALLAWPVGCTTRITPPADPQDPAPIHVLDHGHTATLVVPAAKDEDDDAPLRRYAFGDWRYYAEARANVWNGARALFWPTQGALGRMELQGPAEEAAIRAQVPVGIDRVHRFYVEREAAERLAADLDELHESLRDTELLNPYVELAFIEHPRSYTYFFNSNHMVARWLQQMDCKVKGPAYNSRWRVVNEH